MAVAPAEEEKEEDEEDEEEGKEGRARQAKLPSLGRANDEFFLLLPSPYERRASSSTALLHALPVPWPLLLLPCSP